MWSKITGLKMFSSIYGAPSNHNSKVSNTCQQHSLLLYLISICSHFDSICSHFDYRTWSQLVPTLTTVLDLNLFWLWLLYLIVVCSNFNYYTWSQFVLTLTTVLDLNLFSFWLLYLISICSDLNHWVVNVRTDVDSEQRYCSKGMTIYVWVDEL